MAGLMENRDEQEKKTKIRTIMDKEKKSNK